MQDNASLANYVVEQLQFLGCISSRGIFGGIGIFQEERLLGVVIDGALYLHTGPTNLDDYVSRGMRQFKPYPKAFDLTTDHYETPREVLENPQLLKEWGRRALTATVEGARDRKLASLARAREGQQQRRRQRKEHEAEQKKDDVEPEEGDADQ